MSDSEKTLDQIKQEEFKRGIAYGMLIKENRFVKHIEQICNRLTVIMDEDTDRELKYQKCLEIFNGNCDICLADTVTCHREANGIECHRRIDQALEKMVGAGRVDG